MRGRGCLDQLGHVAGGPDGACNGVLVRTSAWSGRGHARAWRGGQAVSGTHTWATLPTLLASQEDGRLRGDLVNLPGELGLGQPSSAAARPRCVAQLLAVQQ